jgi:hypothetical protein
MLCELDAEWATGAGCQTSRYALQRPTERTLYMSAPKLPPRTVGALETRIGARRKPRRMTAIGTPPRGRRVRVDEGVTSAP